MAKNKENDDLMFEDDDLLFGNEDSNDNNDSDFNEDTSDNDLNFDENILGSDETNDSGNIDDINMDEDQNFDNENNFFTDDENDINTDTDDLEYAEEKPKANKKGKNSHNNEDLLEEADVFENDSSSTDDYEDIDVETDEKGKGKIKNILEKFNNIYANQDLNKESYTEAINKYNEEFLNFIQTNIKDNIKRLKSEINILNKTIRLNKIEHKNLLKIEKMIKDKYINQDASIFEFKDIYLNLDLINKIKNNLELEIKQKQNEIDKLNYFISLYNPEESAEKSN